jgi:hypothetical protein
VLEEQRGNGVPKRAVPLQMHIDWFQKNRLPLALIALGLLAGVPCARGDFQTASLQLGLQQSNIAKSEKSAPMPGKMFARAPDKMDLAEKIRGGVFGGAPSALKMITSSRLDGFFSAQADDEPPVNQGLAYANEVSDLALSDPLPNDFHLRNQSLTLTFSENTVLNLTNFVLKNGILTLEGTTGTMVTINVQNRFSLFNSSQIILSGGLQASDVVFNVLGRGYDVRIRRRSTLTGTLQAPHRDVEMQNHSIVYGYVTAKRIFLRGGSQIIPPPIVSP